MKILDARDLAVPEVKVVTFAWFPDDRGYFAETFRREDLGRVLGIEGLSIVQMNENRSRAGVFRGMHAQWSPYQGKLVRPLRGRLIDMAMDIRLGSPTFGKIVAHDMPATFDGGQSDWIWIPPGFAHGTLFPDDSSIEYLCTGVWSPGCEVSISPIKEGVDSSLIPAPLRQEMERFFESGPIMNEKDAQAPSLAEWASDPRSESFVHSPNAPFGVTART